MTCSAAASASHTTTIKNRRSHSLGNILHLACIQALLDTRAPDDKFADAHAEDRDELHHDVQSRWLSRPCSCRDPRRGLVQARTVVSPPTLTESAWKTLNSRILDSQPACVNKSKSQDPVGRCWFFRSHSQSSRASGCEFEWASAESNQISSRQHRPWRCRV